MGWQDDKHGIEHEGYVLALVTRDGVDRGAGLYRALCYPSDTVSRPFERVGAECTCGWRSWHWEPLHRSWIGEGGLRYTLDWSPFSPSVSLDDEERAYRLWQKHVNDLDAERALIAKD